MCGIIGYVGPRDAGNMIISGLQKLEYRGYDSAGIAVQCSDADEIEVVKVAGKVAALESAFAENARPARGCGIGHTRWATHGEPSKKNAHPHVSADGAIAVVHNGIIENFRQLRSELESRGYDFQSDTDSEVLAHLVADNMKGDLRSAVIAALSLVEGAYGIAVISAGDPDRIVAARKGSPIVIGLGADESIIASDVSAIVSHTQKVVFLDDGDVADVRAESIEITSLKNVPVSRDPTQIDWDPGSVRKGGYEHFMLKEIHEQPEALTNATRGRLLENDGTTRLSGLQMSPAECAAITRLVIAACGTSYYAGMVGKRLFEDLADIPADVEQAAEFRYNNPIIQPGTCMFAVTQSGETADTIEAVREAKRKGAEVFGICNVVGSTIAREADRGVYLHAGPEIGVASTKAFTCQVAVLAMIAILFARSRRMSIDTGRKLVQAVRSIPDIAGRVVEQDKKISELARKYAEAEHFFYLGRGYVYPAALEGALKLKEISYIHAEGYHAAELKHGPIALLDSSVPVMVAVPDIPGKAKTIGNMQECRARKSPVIAVATEGDDEVAAHADDVIPVPSCPDFLSAIPVVIAQQLFAYHVARVRGCPIDQPRNLAKSVTVE